MSNSAAASYSTRLNLSSVLQYISFTDALNQRTDLPLERPPFKTFQSFCGAKCLLSSPVHRHYLSLFSSPSFEQRLHSSVNFWVSLSGRWPSITETGSLVTDTSGSYSYLFNSRSGNRETDFNWWKRIFRRKCNKVLLHVHVRSS
jgi:hypothetical protein